MPPGGELRPLEHTEVKVIFTPQKERSVRTVFDLVVDDGNERLVVCAIQIMNDVIATS